MSLLTDPWIPRFLSEAHLTVNNAGTTSASLTAITGTVSVDGATGAAGNLAVVVGVLATHRYRVQVEVNLSSSNATDDIGVGAATSGVAGTMTGLLSGRTGLYAPTTRFYGLAASGIFYPSANGTLTVTAQYSRVNGSGTITAGSGSSISITDLGLAP